MVMAILDGSMGAHLGNHKDMIIRIILHRVVVSMLPEIMHGSNIFIKGIKEIGKAINVFI
jgi:hypothetical protein